MPRKQRSLAAWIREHRADIDLAVVCQPGARKPRNDEEREEWVSNLEGLYLRAVEAGCDV